MTDPSTWIMPLVFFAVIVGLTVLFAWVAAFAIRNLMIRSNPQVTAAAQRVAVIVISAVGAVIALQEIGVQVTILLLLIAIAGVAGLLAVREPLENFGAKYFADVYSPFKVGDTISVNGYKGKVIEINSMTTLLLSDESHLIALPNSIFLHAPVENFTPQAWKEILVPISLSGSADLPAFESAVLKSLAKLKLHLDPRFPPIFATKSQTSQSIDLVLTVMVRRPEDRDPILAEVNQRVAEATSRIARPSDRPTTPASSGGSVF